MSRPLMSPALLALLLCAACAASPTPTASPAPAEASPLPEPEPVVVMPRPPGRVVTLSAAEAYPEVAFRRVELSSPYRELEATSMRKIWQGEEPRREGVELWPCERPDGTWRVSVTGLRQDKDEWFYDILDYPSLDWLVRNGEGRQIQAIVPHRSMKCVMSRDPETQEVIDLQSELWRAPRLHEEPAPWSSRWWRHEAQHVLGVEGEPVALPSPTLSCRFRFEDETRLRLFCHDTTQPHYTISLLWSPTEDTFYMTDESAPRSERVPNDDRRALILYAETYERLHDEFTGRLYSDADGEVIAFFMEKRGEERKRFALVSRGSAKELRHYDLDAGEYQVIHSFDKRQCKGELAEGVATIERGIPAIAVICVERGKKHPKHLWQQLFHLEDQVTWRTTYRIHDVREDGTIFLTNTSRWDIWSLFSEAWEAKLPWTQR